MACERQLDFYLPVPVMDVFNYVASQKEIYKMKLAAVDRANFKVFFKHRANMLTWGEHITIPFTTRRTAAAGLSWNPSRLWRPH